MVGKISVKVHKVDEELLYRQTEITFDDITIMAPTHAIRYGIDQKKVVAESYSVFDSTRVKRAANDADISSDVEREMKNKNVDGALNLHFVNYTQPTPLTEKEMTALTNLEYVCSDVAVTPCWSGLLKGKVDDDRVKMLNEWNLSAVEAIERRNNKSIMGIIPAKAHHTMIDSIVETFVDEGVTHFAIDHMGRSLKNREAWLRELYIQLGEYKLSDHSLIYSINAPQGRIGQKKEKVLANDFMSPAYGVDVLGFDHTPGRSPKPKPPIPGEAPQAPPEQSFRFFDSDTYAYVKVPESQAKAVLKVPTYQCRNAARLRNATAQLAEYSKLVEMLEEQPTTIGYVRSKEMVSKEIIASIKKVRTDRKVRQRKLFR